MVGSNVSAMLYLALAAGVALPGVAIAFRIASDRDMAWYVFFALTGLAALGTVFAILKQMERVLFMRREDRLQNRFETQAFMGQMRIAQASEQNRLPADTGGGWEDRLLAVITRGRSDRQLPTDVTDATFQEVEG